MAHSDDQMGSLILPTYAWTKVPDLSSMRADHTWLAPDLCAIKGAYVMGFVAGPEIQSVMNVIYLMSFWRNVMRFES